MRKRRAAVKTRGAMGQPYKSLVGKHRVSTRVPAVGGMGPVLIFRPVKWTWGNDRAPRVHVHANPGFNVVRCGQYGRRRAGRCSPLAHVKPRSVSVHRGILSSWFCRSSHDHHLSAYPSSAIVNPLLFRKTPDRLWRNVRGKKNLSRRAGVNALFVSAHHTRQPRRFNVQLYRT